MTDSIYFIQEGPDGAIKIGWTNKPVGERLKAMQTGNSRELRVLAEFPGDRSDELRWHMRFVDLRIRGEWFRPALRLLNAIGINEGIPRPTKRVRIRAQVQPIWSWMVENGVNLEELAFRMGYKPTTLRQQLFSSYGGICSLKMAIALEKATGGFFSADEWQRKSQQERAERDQELYGEFYDPDTQSIDWDAYNAKFDADEIEKRRAEYEALRAEFEADARQAVSA